MFQVVRSHKGGLTTHIRNTEQYLLHTHVLRLDADAAAVPQTVSVSVLENGGIIFQLAAGYGDHVELDCWIRP